MKFARSFGLIKIVSCSLILISISACEGNSLSGREKGVLTGGAIGSGLGAIIGNQSGHAGAGVAIGAAAGALAGGILGNNSDVDAKKNAEIEERQRRQDEEIQRQRRELEDMRRQRDAY